MYAVFSVEKDRIEKADEILKDNIVSRQSIVIRDSAALGIDNENRYILIEGNEEGVRRAEELFRGIEEKNDKEKKERSMKVESGMKTEEEKQEASEEKAKEAPGKEIDKLSEEEASKELHKEIGKKISGEDARKIYDKIKKEEENAAEGVGFIFGE